ncbi:hypothetical protein BPAE_0081g00050 [Botrytis paeoniae]|uniref:Uncharacterized protein n=1 Tax=Botrytis paeoniae TaxID=278948 RepID=A0A4Z1FR63_9HELO|nr:hypothetical protein BPAE_0081g00050 [Botrytis paeoniae]
MISRKARKVANAVKSSLFCNMEIGVIVASSGKFQYIVVEYLIHLSTPKQNFIEQYLPTISDNCLAKGGSIRRSSQPDCSTLKPSQGMLNIGETGAREHCQAYNKMRPEILGVSGTEISGWIRCAHRSRQLSRLILRLVSRPRNDEGYQGIHEHHPGYRLHVQVNKSNLRQRHF